MQKTVKQLTMTPAVLARCKKHDAVVKTCTTQLDNAIKNKKSAAQLVVTMKSVKAKLGKLPPHFGPHCPVQ